MPLTSNAFALNGRNEMNGFFMNWMLLLVHWKLVLIAIAYPILFYGQNLDYILIHAPLVLCQRPTINDTLDNPISWCLEEWTLCSFCCASHVHCTFCFRKTIISVKYRRSMQWLYYYYYNSLFICLSILWCSSSNDHP